MSEEEKRIETMNELSEENAKRIKNFYSEICNKLSLFAGSKKQNERKYECVLALNRAKEMIEGIAVENAKRILRESHEEIFNIGEKLNLVKTVEEAKQLAELFQKKRNFFSQSFSNIDDEVKRMKTEFYRDMKELEHLINKKITEIHLSEFEEAYSAFLASLEGECIKDSFLIYEKLVEKNICLGGTKTETMEDVEKLLLHESATLFSSLIESVKEKLGKFSENCSEQLEKWRNFVLNEAGKEKLLSQVVKNDKTLYGKYREFKRFVLKKVDSELDEMERKIHERFSEMESSEMLKLLPKMEMWLDIAEEPFLGNTAVHRKKIRFMEGALDITKVSDDEDLERLSEDEINEDDEEEEQEED